MELTEIKNIDENDSWSLLHYRRQALLQPKPRWAFAILMLVIFSHIGVIGYLFSWRVTALQYAPVSDDVLEVTFIDRAPTTAALEIESRSTADKNQNTKPVARRMLFRPNTETTTTAAGIEQTTDTALRLTMDNDEWNVAPVIEPKNPLQRQFIAMPGRAEPFVKGMKFRKQLSPQQKLAMVGKLFGAVEYDACKEARSRLASGESQLHDIDLEADLRSIEHHCRP